MQKQYSQSAKERIFTMTNEKPFLKYDLFKHGPVLVFKIKSTPGWPLEYVTPNVKEILGYTQEEILSGKVTYSQIVHKDDYKILQEAMKENLEAKTGFFYNHPYRVIHKNGRIVWFHNFNAAIYDEQGDIAGYHGYVVDITELKNSEQQVKQKEQELRNLVLVKNAVLESPLGIVVFALDNEYRYIDFTMLHKNTMKAIWGIDIEIGKNMLDYIKNPEDREKAKINFDRALKGESFILHEEYGDEKLKRTYYENRYAPIYNEKNEIMGLSVYVIDITKQKRIEAQLKEKEATNRAILEAIPDLMFVIDKNYVFKSYYSASKEELIAKPEFFLGKTLDEVLPSSLVELTKNRIIEAINSRNIIKYEYSVVLNNQTKHYEARMVYKGNDEILSIVRDITKRKNAEEQLKNSEENLRITLNSIGDAVIAVDTETRITHMNPIAENLTGWKFSDAKGRFLEEIFNIINEDTRKQVEHPVKKVLQDHKIVGLANHTILISKSSEEYNIADSAAPISDEEGNIRGVVLVFRDITEQAKAEKELIRFKKLESVGLLAGGIAHDFNNILTGVFGNMELAKSELPEDNPAYAFLKDAGSALQRATSLTKQLLTFARGGDPILEAVDLKSVLENTVNFNLSGSNVRAEFYLPDKLWNIKADKGQISQVISNLTINALQSMPSGGCLKISAENINNNEKDSRGKFVKLCIKDEGIGIPAKYLDKIFDPYFTTKQAGSGLGLSIVHSIITKHDGFIKVYSKPENGTEFCIYLPADPKTEQNSNILDGLNKIDNKSKALKRILIVDDEEMIRKVLGVMLHSFGYAVDFAESGEEALDKYVAAQTENNSFDAVIMDLTIPGGIGGKEAARKLLSVDPSAKVLVCSGYSTDPVMSDYTKYGFVGKLAKPFKKEDLKSELNRIL